MARVFEDLGGLMTVQGDMSFSQLTKPGFVYLNKGTNDFVEDIYFSFDWRFAIDFFPCCFFGLAIIFRIPTGLGYDVWNLRGFNATCGWTMMMR